MESFFTRFKNVLVLVAILLAQTIGLAVQVRRPVESGAPDGESVTLIRYWVVSTVTPLERFFHGFGYIVRHAWSNNISQTTGCVSLPSINPPMPRMKPLPGPASASAFAGPSAIHASLAARKSSPPKL